MAALPEHLTQRLPVRRAFQISEKARDNLKMLAKRFKLNQFDVVSLLLERANTDQLEDAAIELHDKIQADKDARKELMNKLSKLSPKELAAAAKNL